MEKITFIVNKIIHTSILNSLIIVIIGIVLYKMVMCILTKSSENAIRRGFSSKKGETYMKMTKSVIRYIFLIITVLIVLQINGINVSSMLAGVGIAGVIIGFAVQDVLKDIIKGITIISDQYFHVGDIIKYNDFEAKVLAIGLKTTKVENVRTFNIVSIANRNIEQVEVVSDTIDMMIPMPYNLKIEEAEKIVEFIMQKVRELKDVKSCEYKGVGEITDSSINYQIRVHCKPDLKVQMRRDILRAILVGLEENRIEVPYRQIDIHQK